MKTLISFLLFLSFLTSSIFTQNLFIMDKDAPWKGAIEDISIGEVISDPGIKVIYVATQKGLFKSTNDGLNWISLFSDYCRVVECLVHNPSIVYASKEELGIYKSTDNGETFNAINTGITYNSLFLRLTISPYDYNLILAGRYEYGSQTLYRSSNAGQTWNYVDYNGSLFIDYSIEDIVFSSIYSNVVYLAARGNNTDCEHGIGVYKSEDYGITWYPINAGLSTCQMFSIGVEPVNQYYENIYSSTDGIIYKLSPYIENWIPVFTGMMGTVQDFEVKSGNIFGAVQDYCQLLPYGIILSSNQGQNWSYQNNGILSLTAYAISTESQTNNIWTGGAYGGFYKSTNNGNTFEENLVKGQKVPIHSVASVNNNIITGGSFSTSFNLSTDNGTTWKSIYNECGETWIYDIECDENFTNIYSTQNREGEIDAVFLKSSNSGINWYTTMSFDDPLAVARFRDIAIDPVSPNMLYLCGNRGYEVRKSTDYGETWAESLNEQINAAGYYALAVDEYSSMNEVCQNIYVGGTLGAPMKRSTNAGQVDSWSPFYDGDLAFDTYIYSLSISKA